LTFSFTPVSFSLEIEPNLLQVELFGGSEIAANIQTCDYCYRALAPMQVTQQRRSFAEREHDSADWVSTVLFCNQQL